MLPRSLLRFLAVLVFAPPVFVFAAASPAGPDFAARVELGAYATVLQVDATSGDDVKGDGSVVHPFASLLSALEAAGQPSPGKRTAILVSAGRYAQPTFDLKSRVDLYGGYAKPGGDRDLHRYPVYLDGVEEHRIAFGADDARVDGFHFVNGRVRGKGAALLCDGTSPTITNCVFTNNRTLVPSPWRPALLHETANDGGAIMCLNGSAARIEHNLFYANSTECGRGAAIASDRAAAPHVVGNVFANNRAGLSDPMRSSDGGAISFFNWSRGEITGNVVVANEALARNDAGGVFVALWSAPSVSNNVIVANEGGDDAGGLFLGGQEHRYDGPLDAYPSADRYRVEVTGNVLVGNTNSTKNSGAMRVTMETRAHFAHNIIAENQGGFYLQRSEITADHNTVWQEWRFLEDKPSLGASSFSDNIFKGPTDAVESSRVAFHRNMAPTNTPGGPHLAVADVFEADQVNGELTDLQFDPVSCTTTVTSKDPFPPGAYAGRPIRMGDNKAGGQWRVIARAEGRELVLWGRLDAVTKAPKYFEIMRTFTPKTDAPAGLGATVRKASP